MENLVCTELTSAVTFQMLEDKMVCIIADNGLFLVTTEENSKKYKEDFYPVDVEGQKAYGIVVREGRVVSEFSR